MAPFLLATFYFGLILTLVPRPHLSRGEILLPAVLGAALWEAARHIFGALMGTDSAYLRIFGPLGGVVALLSWVYLSSTILVLTGQFTWAYAMERRGRGRSASMAPREAGLTVLDPPLPRRQCRKRGLQRLVVTTPSEEASLSLCERQVRCHCSVWRERVDC